MIEQLPSEVSSEKATVWARRTFIRNTALVGGGTAAAFMLSACSSGTQSNNGSGSSDDSSEKGPGTSAEPITLVAAEVPVGGGVVLTKHEVVVTQPEAGTFLAFSAVCTHKGCLLTSVEERGSFCACHSSYFDITTGVPVAGPAQAPLQSFPVTVSGDTLVIG